MADPVGHVLLDGEMRKKRRGLADERDLPVARFHGGLAPELARDEFAVHADLAPTQTSETRDRLEDRRLSCSRGTEDGKSLTGFETESGSNCDLPALDFEIDREQWRGCGAHGASTPWMRARVRALHK